MEAPARGPAISSLELVQQIEVRDPRVQVSFVPLVAESGESLHFVVQPRIDPATGMLLAPGYNQVFIDPASGTELGRREWGAVWPITKETLVSFLYKLHFSLHLPEMRGSDRWGIWLLGVIAILWTVDCFTGVYLTFPANRRGAARPPRRSCCSAGCRPGTCAKGRQLQAQLRPAWAAYMDLGLALHPGVHCLFPESLPRKLLPADVQRHPSHADAVRYASSRGTTATDRSPRRLCRDR